MLTGHCVMLRHLESMQLPLNDYCRVCKSAEEEETVIHVLCQCPFLSRCIYHRLFGSPFLVSLTELSSIDVKDIGSFIKLSSLFSSLD